MNQETNKAFFLLSDQSTDIYRFHLCTWDIEHADALVEVGIEFSFKGRQPKFKLILPFVLSSEPSSITSLHRNLADTSNCKFIFNDIVTNAAPIGGDDRNGVEIEFVERDKLTVLPATEIEIRSQVVSFSVPAPPPESKEKNFYIRLLLRPHVNTLAYERAGIAKNALIYDVKLNEKRNLPDLVHELLAPRGAFSLCTINRCFCFHIVPNSFDISFVAQTHLKNIRGLEVSAFQRYLPEDLKTLREGHYTIVFNKQEGQNFSFFTKFSKEHIGSKQIVFAIIANVKCRLFRLACMHCVSL